MSQNLSSALHQDEAKTLGGLLKTLSWDDALARRVEDRAAGLVQRIRSEKAPPGQLESFLQQYSLNTDEGVALMCLAEALLRIPDKETARALIHDKVGAANWLGKAAGSKDWVVKAAGLGLLVTSKTLDSALSRISEPVIHSAMLKAMHIMGQQFVLGGTIEDAVKNAAPYIKKGYRMSYDLLGEGARTATDAERYSGNYAHAIRIIGERKSAPQERPPGISVKLSALHPRYFFAQKDHCVPVMTERLGELCVLAAGRNIPLTVDAEEAERLELSLDILRGVLKNKNLADWDGLGVAVQAYQKRALPLLDELAGLAKARQRRLQLRLVKGAYWDSEIKRAQVLGLPDYPVFTRKENTDVSYLACTEKIFRNKDVFYPMLGTHNAHTAAAVIEMAKDFSTEFEFQRLFGMGESLFNILLKDGAAQASIYAPVGSHEDLLAYLVRRLLENGANTSFVNRLMNPDEAVDNLVRDPVKKAQGRNDQRHSRIPLPKDLYAQEAPQGRRNSPGMDLSDPATVVALLKDMKRFEKPYEAMPLVGGKVYKDTVAQDVKNPADYTDNLGRVWPGNKGLADKAVRVAGEGFAAWSRTEAQERARILERYADLLERHRAELMALCIREAGKTIPDALAEVREAVDLARYYANQGQREFFDKVLPGPTGEENILRLEGRGVFACISPWNFPLAIFTGQITAALMAGNAVVAKPAEQTPLIAMKAVRLMHEAGIPADALNLLTGDGVAGAALVANPDIAGVAFTGSTEVAWEINKTLAAKRGPIVPFIAETGGMNAMIVDTSALPEQVIDDVVLSAFGSAGQRCSALRILCVQEETADKVIRMLEGAMKEIHVGNPRNLSSDLGPVIDDEARGKLATHRENLRGFGKLICEVPLDSDLRNQGHYFAPCAFELTGLEGLEREVFGPILHVVRYERNRIDELIADINNKGYGLTLGVHSRIDAFQDYIATRVRAGNAYVNRSMIGAVVGSQPFGGQGLSGTGPKAGGPHYLPAFAHERVISVNTTAAGGNASLVSLDD